MPNPVTEEKKPTSPNESVASPPPFQRTTEQRRNSFQNNAARYLGFLNAGNNRGLLALASESAHKLAQEQPAHQNQPRI